MDEIVCLSVLHFGSTCMVGQYEVTIMDPADNSTPHMMTLFEYFAFLASKTVNASKSEKLLSHQTASFKPETDPELAGLQPDDSATDSRSLLSGGLVWHSKEPPREGVAPEDAEALRCHQSQALQPRCSPATQSLSSLVLQSLRP